MTRRTSFCDGVKRRDMLKIGAAGAMGFGVSLPQILQQQAQAANRSAEDISFICVFLQGGLSTIDTWDMKPEAPAEFRGEFKPISTNVPGIQLCEQLPRLSKEMDKLALVRSFGHSNSGHGPADHFMLTGS